MTRTVLVVEDDREVREALGQTLQLAEIEPILAGSFVAAKDHITPEFSGVILSDIRMPGRDGFHVLSYARAQDSELPVVLLTGEGDIPMAVRATHEGAFDFLEKPCSPNDLMAVLERALHTRALTIENRALRAQVQAGDPAARLLHGISQAADGLRTRVRRIAQAGGDALILGPPGSGIPKVAEVLHLCSPQSKAAFVKRAGGALTPEGLAGALTQAAGGSLFLDEVSQLPQETQLALTEALEVAPRACIYLGATADLDAAVASGEVHPDLYYRVAGASVHVPALADRREDIPVLFQHYVAQAAEQAGRAAPEIPPQMLTDLMRRDWPGNARALMSEAMQFALGLVEMPAQSDQLGLAEQMAQVEKSLLDQALRRAGGRAAEVAEALKLPRKTLYDKLARHGLKPDDYRA